MNARYANMPVTVFERISARARAANAINLGQGFPDGRGPADVLAAAARALEDQSNQYPPMTGIPELRAAVATHYNRHQGLDLVADEVVVTSGATEALSAAILAMVAPGDEVVLLQPLYDSYLPMVEQAGGVARLVTLEPPAWQVNPQALAAAFNAKTRLIILNSPHNPTGTLLAPETLAQIAALCCRYDVVALCDEVWEHVVFAPAQHRSLMHFPGMRDRTIKIGSAGKIFALTGWKVGWACAAPDLVRVVARAHQFLTFTTPPNLQHAVAYGLGKTDDYFVGMRSDFARSNDRLAAGLRAAGYHIADGAGTYFIVINLPASGLMCSDEAFCDASLEDGVAAIPMSAFYAAAPRRDHVRLCFAKADSTLDAAIERLCTTRQRLLQATSVSSR